MLVFITEKKGCNLQYKKPVKNILRRKRKMNFIPLVSNVERVEKGKKVIDHEISVSVLASEIHEADPKFYASRAGRLYDPSTGFNVVEGFTGNKLPDKLHEEFYSLLSEAREALPKIREELAKKFIKSTKGNEGQTVEIEQLKVIVKSQEEQINELLNKKDHSDEMKQLKELLQAKTKEIEALKAGENKEVKHHKFAKIVRLLEKRRVPYLYGPAGTGKSNLVKQIAKHMGLDFLPMSTITQEFKFTGYQDGNGLYHDTNFYKAVKNGGLFFIDEMDSCSSDVLVGLNACIANRYFDFPHETIDCHKDFYIIGAGNTTGRGAEKGYVARQALDLSTLDRFVTQYIDYDENIEIAVVKGDQELVKFAHALRQASADTDIQVLISYRALLDITELKDDDLFTLPEVMDMSIVKGLRADDLYMLVNRMDIDQSNKYYNALKEVA
jgi:cobaltochelatase CobS